MLPGVTAQAAIFIVLTWGSLYLKSIPDIKQIPEDMERQTSQASVESVGRDATHLTFHIETNRGEGEGVKFPEPALRNPSRVMREVQLAALVKIPCFYSPPSHSASKRAGLSCTDEGSNESTSISLGKKKNSIESHATISALHHFCLSLLPVKANSQPEL